MTQTEIEKIILYTQARILREHHCPATVEDLALAIAKKMPKLDREKVRGILNECFSGQFAGGDLGNIPIFPDKDKVDQATDQILALVNGGKE